MKGIVMDYDFVEIQKNKKESKKAILEEARKREQRRKEKHKKLNQIEGMEDYEAHVEKSNIDSKAHKREIKNYKNLIQRKEKEIKALRLQLQEKQVKEKKMKDYIHQNYMEIKVLKEKLDQCKSIEKEHIGALNLLKLERQRNEKLEKTLRIQGKYLKEKAGQYQFRESLKGQVKNLQKEIEAFKIYGDNERLELKADIKGLHSRIRAYQIWEHKLKQEPIRAMKFFKEPIQKKNVQEILKWLEDHLNLGSVQAYIDKGKNTTDSLVSKIYKYKIKEERLREFNRKILEEANKNKEINMEIGVIIKDTNDQFCVKVLDEKETIHHISYKENTLQEEDVYEGLPVAVCKDDKNENRYILEKYSYRIRRRVNHRKLKKKEMVKDEKVCKQNKEDIQKVGDFSVLVFAGRFKARYKDYLENYGYKVDVYDGFSESTYNLRSRVKKANVILICTKHVPHMVLDFVETNDKRVIKLTVDNKEMLGYRTWFKLKELHLI